MADEKNWFGEIVAKCWEDAAFKQRFVTEPRAVLGEYSIDVPANIAVRVVENTDDTIFITLPTKPTRGELTDGELDSVSGGAGTIAGQAVLLGAKKQLTAIVNTSAASNTCGPSNKACWV